MKAKDAAKQIWSTGEYDQHHKLSPVNAAVGAAEYLRTPADGSYQNWLRSFMAQWTKLQNGDIRMNKAAAKYRYEQRVIAERRAAYTVKVKAARCNEVARIPAGQRDNDLYDKRGQELDAAIEEYLLAHNAVIEDQLALECWDI